MTATFDPSTVPAGMSRRDQIVWILEEATREWFAGLVEREMQHLRGRASISRSDIRTAMGIAHIQTIRQIASGIAQQESQRGVAATQWVPEVSGEPEYAGLSPSLGGK